MVDAVSALLPLTVPWGPVDGVLSSKLGLFEGSVMITFLTEPGLGDQ